MKPRIAIWALAGFVVACCWSLYLFQTHMISGQWAVRALTFMTFPVSMVGLSWRISLYWALFANAIIYAFVGLIVESRRERIIAQKRTG